MPARAYEQKSFAPLAEMGPAVQSISSPYASQGTHLPRKGLGRAVTSGPIGQVGALDDSVHCSDLLLEVKAIVRDDIAAACKSQSQEQLCERLTKLLGEEVSRWRLEKIGNSTKATKRLASDWIPSWVAVTGSTRILEVLCMAAGGRYATAEDWRLRELGEAYETARKANERLDEVFEGAA